MSVPLSKSVVVGNLMFVSGQIYLTSDGVLLEGSVADKTRQIMRNISVILEDVGSELRNIVKVTIYVTDMDVYGALNEVYASYFEDGKFPAREVVCVKALPLGAEIEISVVARRDG